MKTKKFASITILVFLILGAIVTTATADVVIIAPKDGAYIDGFSCTYLVLYPTGSPFDITLKWECDSGDEIVDCQSDSFTFTLSEPAAAFTLSSWAQVDGLPMPLQAVIFDTSAPTPDTRTVYLDTSGKDCKKDKCVGYVEYTYVGSTVNDDGEATYEFKVTNCYKWGMSNFAIGLPEVIPPIPEFSTAVLFLTSLLVMGGYVKFKRTKE